MSPLSIHLPLFPDLLTVLAYHRVEDPARPDFDTFKPNVSATPDGFRRQMEFMKEHYNVMGGEQLSGWLRGESEMPQRAAMITFDDGYCDNLVNAYPVLRDLALPATIFLCTDRIGSDEPFDWDFAAYCFAHTVLRSADLPLLGSRRWGSEAERDAVLRSWYEAAKKQPGSAMAAILGGLQQALDVSVPKHSFAGLHLDWDQVRELSRAGIEMGAHTASHPLLTAVSLEEAESEILGSRKRIESEIGKPVQTFAYPNGGAGDYTERHIEMLRRAGFASAFTLIPGPTRYSTVRRAPLEIRRIFITHRDGWPRFLSKLAGLPRLTA